MITLTAKINLISDDNGSLNSVSSELLGNNISSDWQSIKGVKSQGSNPFIIGASKLGDGSTFSDKVDYFIGSQLSDDNGEFQPPCEITVNGYNIKSLTIAFDTVNNRHPNTIKIDNMEYADDDAIFTISNLSSANTHTITIDNWNAPNYPLVITGIYVEISIDIDYRNLISLNRSITYRADNKLPSYGIISNTGNLEFNDLNGEIRDYAEQMLLTSDLKVKITLNNTLANTHEQVGIFETETWDYDNDNRSVSVSLKDDLEEWQDINIDSFFVDPISPNAKSDGTMRSIYNWLKSKTPQKYEMLPFYNLDDRTKTILIDTIVLYPFVKSGTLWEQWTKLCQVCGLYIYKNNEGKTVCSYTYGS